MLVFVFGNTAQIKWFKAYSYVGVALLVVANCGVSDLLVRGTYIRTEFIMSEIPKQQVGVPQLILLKALTCGFK